MFRHIVIAALRNMAANKLISAIAIVGLTIGITATMLMGLIVRNQLNFDSFIPGHEQIYLAVSPPDPRVPPALGWQERADYRLGEFLKRTEPSVQSVARMTLPWSDQTEKLQRGAVNGWEQVYWADANIFNLLPLPVLQGDLATALRQPDGIVLTRSAAHKYFGRDSVVGQTIQLNGHPMLVRAVIDDLPLKGTRLKTGIFASGSAPFSRLAPADLPQQSLSHDMEADAFTYVRLRPNADLAGIERRAASHFMRDDVNAEFPLLKLLPVTQVNIFAPLNPGIRARLAAAGMAGLLVLLIAAINFVNLTVARSARREREVGVRKALGAGRVDLVVQFLGEAVIAVILATGAAMVLSEWLLPPLNAFLGTGAQPDFGAPQLAFMLLVSLTALALAAGAWPALLLSSFRPAFVLRGWSPALGGGEAIRSMLVGLQFCVLVVLAISAWVIWQQRQFALHDALRANADEMVVFKFAAVDAPFGVGSDCASAFLSEVRKLPGVQGAACSHGAFLAGGSNIVHPQSWIAGSKSIAMSNVGTGLFQLYGIKPLAGNFNNEAGTVINLAAMHLLGFASPAAAVGNSWIPANPPRAVARNFGTHGIITAVVPDFAFYSVEKPIVPELFGRWFGSPNMAHVRLKGHDIPETLAAIDQLWAQTGMKGPENRVFLDDIMQQQYRDMTRQAALLGAFAGTAILLACMGLFGIAISTAERRTKEIGVRKAMGAGDVQIVALLLWQFAQPVLWANVIAWPVAWWLMRRWLSGFAYHVDLHWWIFADVSLGALLVALLTVAGQAWLTARQKPVLALRYE